MRTKYGDNTELADPTKLADNVWSWDCPPPVDPVVIVIPPEPPVGQVGANVEPPAPLCE